MAAYTEFELDLTKALLEHLPPIFEHLDGAALTLPEVDKLPESAQGVYMLLEDGTPMYIGKTDAAHGFKTRLQRHFYTLSARKKLELDKVSFKAVRIMVFTTINVERTLIDYFLGNDPLRWQNSGFGSNDPGHNREGQEPSKFDVTYPIDIDKSLSFIPTGSLSVRDLLLLLKEGLPYDLRYETDKSPTGKPVKHTIAHEDHRNAIVNVPRPMMSLRELFDGIILQALPSEWIATVFPGRVIFYKEQTTYRYALEQLRI